MKSNAFFFRSTLLSVIAFLPGFTNGEERGMTVFSVFEVEESEFEKSPESDPRFVNYDNKIYKKGEGDSFRLDDASLLYLPEGFSIMIKVHSGDGGEFTSWINRRIGKDIAVISSKKPVFVGKIRHKVSHGVMQLEGAFSLQRAKMMLRALTGDDDK